MNFKHDCDGCTFLGSVAGKEEGSNVADLYLCCANQDLIARRSSRCDDYSSSDVEAATMGAASPLILAAYYLAKARGML